MLITGSVMLAALVTVIWLPLAVLGAKGSPWAWMTLAMLAMLWRGEAWKRVCQKEQAELSQCLQQSPKTGFSGLGSSLADGESRSERMPFSEQFLPPVTLSWLQPRETCPAHREERSSHPENRHTLPPASHLTFYPASLCPALCLDMPSRISLGGFPQLDLIKTALEKPYPNGGNTSLLHMTYIV